MLVRALLQLAHPIAHYGRHTAPGFAEGHIGGTPPVCSQNTQDPLKLSQPEGTWELDPYVLET